MVAVRFAKDAVFLENDEVELVAATSFGPRILRYAARGGDNVFGWLDPREQANATPFGDDWHIYGGHRLWHGPEHPVRTYVPDNTPIRARQEGDATLVLTQDVERETSLIKEMSVTLEAQGSRVTLVHRIMNAGKSSVDLAVWALSLMARGGEAIVPKPPFVPHPDGLLPVQRFVLWPYSDFADPRFSFGRRFTRVRQDPNAAAPQKIGIYDGTHGWAAYAVGTQLFVKRFEKADPQTPLVDLGCNVEIFSNAAFLELETLSKRMTIQPGETATHTETWELFRGHTRSSDDDATYRAFRELGICA